MKYIGQFFTFFLLLLIFPLYYSISTVFADELPNEEKEVIVVYKNQDGKEATVEDSIRVEYQFKSVPAVSVVTTEEELTELEANKDIAYIEESLPFSITDTNTTKVLNTLADYSTGTTPWNINATNVRALWNEGFTGKGIKVAVLDTGIANHSELNISGGVSTVDNTTMWHDDHGHGTHVSGIIAAQPNIRRINGFDIVGVSPDVSLYAVKVLDSQGIGSLQDILEGLDWAITNNMDIVNLSFGTSGYSQLFEQMINNAYNKGIVIVAASGNDGLENSVNYPAKFANVNAISSVNQSLSLSSFSSTGKEVDFSAPGETILSTFTGENYAYQSGTSQATPHVTGMLALLKQKYPFLTNSQLKSLLSKYTTDLGTYGLDPFYGHGFISYNSGAEQAVLTDSVMDQGFKQGTYTVGEEVQPGLTRFSVSNGEASLLITRGNEVIVFVNIESKPFYYSDKFIANLKEGDNIEIFSNRELTSVGVEKVSTVDVSKLSSGYYEIGTDIPTGTYTITFDSPNEKDSTADIRIFNSNYMTKNFYSVSSNDPPFDYTFVKGDMVYLANYLGTMNLKEKVLIPTSITLNKSTISLLVSRSTQLKATVSPSTAYNKGVSWISSNPAVATVDSNGNVKAIKAGTTTVTAIAKGNTSVKNSTKLTVKNILPTSLKLSKSTLNISKQQAFKVTATVSPSNATVKTVTWRSSNTKVATVDSRGIIKGNTNGTATITATTKDNTKVYKKITVKVSNKTVKVNKSSLSVVVGNSSTIKATVSPSDSTEKTVKWKSSNTKIATVDSKGKVTGKSNGTATITATVKGAKEIKVKVTVNRPVAAKSVKLNKKYATLSKGKTLTLSATVSPSNTTNKTVSWKSSNSSIASVDSKGRVQAVRSGTAKITGTTSNGKKAIFTVRVR
ncbi:S8 family serine peptidase [Aquibacillus kalidii]|uniref:S8 family serine peptidase n=1 Tax=Aquibacillus kalidii TaxID=2762597 RepID=UPI001645268D|nr:S8 family serine peptidase [Aquibacillus kalidii]